MRQGRGPLTAIAPRVLLSKCPIPFTCELCHRTAGTDDKTLGKNSSPCIKLTDDFDLPVNDLDWQLQETVEDVSVTGDFFSPQKPSDKCAMIGAVCIPADYRGRPGTLRLHGRVSSGRIWHAYKASWNAFQRAETASTDPSDTSHTVSEATSPPGIVIKFCVTGLREGARWRKDYDRVVRDRAAVHTEAKLYCGRLQPLQGSVVPRYYGLWKASLHGQEVYAIILEYVPSDIAMPLSSQEL